RKDPLAIIDEVGDVAGNLAVGRADDADRLVERDIDVLLLATHRLAVDTDDIALPDLNAQRRNLTVDGHPPGFDPGIGLTPRAQARLRNVLVQPHFRSASRGRNELVVALVLTLELEELVVTA